MIFPERTIHRLFFKHEDTRQVVDVYEIQVARSVGECSTICTAKARECVGFNLKLGPPIICELSRVPHDAPNADMVVGSAWDHYAIVP